MSQTATQAREAIPRTPQVTALLVNIQELLEDQKYPQAFEVIARAKVDSPWLSNALGVCYLRTGKASSAVEVFRGLVLKTGGLVLREDVPAVFKTNYVTALFLSGNLDGGLGVLRELGEESGEAGSRLFRAADDWVGDLSIFQKLNWYLGGKPSHPIQLDFPPGDLE